MRKMEWSYPSVYLATEVWTLADLWRNVFAIFFLLDTLFLRHTSLDQFVCIYTCRQLQGFSDNTSVYLITWKLACFITWSICFVTLVFKYLTVSLMLFILLKMLLLTRLIRFSYFKSKESSRRERRKK